MRNFFIAGILISCLVFSSYGFDGNFTDVKRHGLIVNGSHVCSFETTEYRMVNISYVQQKVVTKYYKSCSWGSCKKRTKSVVVSYREFREVPKEFRIKNLYCCAGWTRDNKHKKQCKKPVCDIPCRHDGECVEPNKCKCKPGFAGDFCQRVLDDCASERNDCEQICIRQVPGHRCECKDGWTLKTDKKHCDDVNECKSEHPPCKCKTDDGVCKPKCENTPGSYKCGCMKGYVLNSAEECEDINECFNDPHICDQLCENTPGSYKCKCVKGFKRNEEKKVCEDIDECKVGKGGCSDTCINTPGSYFCTCPFGFYLDKDKKTCKPVKPSMSSKIICQSDMVGELSCPKYEEKLMIIDAMYGRLTTEFCKTGNYTQDVRCVSKQSPLKTVMDTCDNLNSCVVMIDTEVFGDPCPAIEKYLLITYECEK